MLKQITVTEGSGWQRYKSEGDDPIAPGLYYIFRSHMKPEVKERFKNQMAPVAAQDKDGKFAWLLPAERWVKCVMDGFLPPELTLYGQVEDINSNRREAERLLKLPSKLLDKARVWQRAFILDYLYAREQEREYRRAGIVLVGGGKTFTGLAIAQDHKSALVLAPSYCHPSWKDEAAKWGLKCPRLSTYESAHKQDPADCLILDEALLVANPHTRRHTHALRLSEQARTSIGLTGTPQSTSPMDLRWLRCVYPGSVPADEKPWRFLFGKDTELVEVKPGQQAYVTKTWDQEAVSKFVAPYVMAVDPAEIRKDLPEIEYKRLYVPAPKEYQLILKGAATEKGKSKAIAQARMCTDGAITGDDGRILAKLATSKLDVIEQFLDNLGEAAVIFARWSYAVDFLSQRFSSRQPAVLSGGADHGSQIDAFTRGRTNLLIANACISQGMNLQERARVVIFMSNSLKPTDREQAIGRVYRPGQTRGVIVVDVIAEGTLDEPALDLLEKHKGKSEAYIESALKREFEKQMKGAAG